jgi:magnesium-transporting ATPase (P-type)
MTFLKNRELLVCDIVLLEEGIKIAADELCIDSDGLKLIRVRQMVNERPLQGMSKIHS